MIFMLNSRDPPSCYSAGSTGVFCGAGPVRLYFTRPRRTSSVAITVGFFEDVGSTGPALQLPGALRRYDDKPVRALLRIVRKGAMRVVAWSLVSHVFDTSSNFKC